MKHGCHFGNERRSQTGGLFDRIGWLLPIINLVDYGAYRALITHGAFADARAVLEIGAGTGRLAKTLLRNHLPDNAAYVALELSPALTRYLRRQLAPFSARVECRTVSGQLPYDFADGSFDRILSTFVFDGMGSDEIVKQLAEANRLLRPGGLMCLLTTSPGTVPWSRAVMHIWSLLHSINPALVGLSSAMQMRPFLNGRLWTLRHHSVVSTLGLSSEAIVAARET